MKSKISAERDQSSRFPKGNNQKGGHRADTDWTREQMLQQNYHPTTTVPEREKQKRV